MAYPVTLTASFRTTAESLELTYTVNNAAREPVFVVNVSLRTTSEGTVAVPGIPRVELMPDGLVLLHSALRPTPRGVAYSAPPQAYASRLEAGASFKQTLWLPLPLAPTRLPPAREPREAIFERVAFVLGVVPASAVPNAQKQEIGGAEVWRLPIGAVQHQVELRADARIANLRVLVEK